MDRSNEVTVQYSFTEEEMFQEKNIFKRLRMYMNHPDGCSWPTMVKFLLILVIKTPGFIFHEACHLFLIFVTGTSIDSSGFKYCNIYRNDENKLILNSFCWPISFSSNPISTILIGGAPLIGLAILVTIPFIFETDFRLTFAMYGYIMIAPDMFMLSPPDIKTVKSGWQRLINKDQEETQEDVDS